MSVATALAAIPNGLRQPLIAEYQSIVENYAEHRWLPSELSGGKFCEIVYTILNGHATGIFATSPGKPKDFVAACRKLESNPNVPRSFQILIPRLLPALYEVRNNRGVGHVGGDVDPNHMDSTFVITSCNWIMAELVRVFHAITCQEAQVIVDNLVELRIPLIWQQNEIKRILDPSVTISEQILIFLATSAHIVSTNDLQSWCDYKNRSYFFKLLRKLHSARKVELSKDETQVQILPPGSADAAGLVHKFSLKH